MKYGYCRVSSISQDLTIQQEALAAAGCDVIRSEKVSGTSFQGRDELSNLLDFVRPGDTILCTRIDRISRSVLDLQNLVHNLREKGVTLQATEQPIDTSTSAGKCFLDMLSVFSEFEVSLKKERQAEGIAKAKERGVYAGRKQSINVDKVRELRDQGLGATAISNRMSISRASVYRVLG